MSKRDGILRCGLEDVFLCAVDVEESKRDDSHFDTEDKVWDTDGEVLECHVGGWIELVRGGKEGEYSL